MLAWAIGRREVFVAIRCQAVENVTIAFTVWRRWLHGFDPRRNSMAWSIAAGRNVKKWHRLELRNPLLFATTYFRKF